MATTNTSTHYEPGQEPLFHGVNFTVICSAELPADDLRKVVDNMNTHGGTYSPLNRDGRVEDVSKVTHIIAATSDFPDYDAALDQFVSVVKPSWVEASLLKQKMPNP
ncbi:hypothetical protein LTS18_000994, partial [Coniosporium uncinatum]